LRLRGKQIGFALPEGHFSMHSILYEIKKMVSAGAEVFPLILDTEDSYEHDEQFNKNRRLLEEITGREMLTTSLADEAADDGNVRFDLLVVAPCTGNFLARLMNARRTAVPLNKTLQHLETGCPVVLALIANGDSENLFLNVAQILNLKNFYLVPFGPVEKGNKQIFLARLELLFDTVLYALAHRQLQPVYIEPCWLPH
jgi:dipicolinate synthase subunit B